MNTLRVFAGNGNPAIAASIADYVGTGLGQAHLGRFPDGEIDLKVDEDVRGCDCFVVQPTCPPVNEHLLELLVFADCLQRASASRVTAVMPYFGYARKDRKDAGRVPITAKLVANLLTKAGVDRVLALDLHADQIQGFFDIPVDHLFAAPIIQDYCRESELEKLIFVSPDAGGIKMARLHADELHCPLAVVDKRRVSPDKAEVGFVIGDVKGRNVVMVDDMIATGGSISEAARLLMDHGALDVRVAATHPVFCGSAAERLQAAPIVEIAVTDTIPLNANARAIGDRIRVLSVADLLGEAIKRIHLNQSVSSLCRREP